MSELTGNNSQFPRGRILLICLARRWWTLARDEACGQRSRGRRALCTSSAGIASMCRSAGGRGLLGNVESRRADRVTASLNSRPIHLHKTYKRSATLSSFLSTTMADSGHQQLRTSPKSAFFPTLSPVHSPESVHHASCALACC
jgi:hypothetical protein